MKLWSKVLDMFSEHDEVILILLFYISVGLMLFYKKGDESGWKWVLDIMYVCRINVFLTRREMKAVSNEFQIWLVRIMKWYWFFVSDKVHFYKNGNENC